MITHLPLLLDRARGAPGTLIGHVARANPHWRKLQERPDATGRLSRPSRVCVAVMVQRAPERADLELRRRPRAGQARLIR